MDKQDLYSKDYNYSIMTKKSKLELLIEKENMEGIAEHIKTNRRLIDYINSGDDSESTGLWQRICKNSLEFNLESYRFIIKKEYKEWYDTREDDGTSAGWTTESRKNYLIIKKGNNQLINISGSKYVRGIKDAIFEEVYYREKLLKDIIGKIDLSEIEEIKVRKRTGKQVGGWDTWAPVVRTRCYNVIGEKYDTTISQKEKYAEGIYVRYNPKESEWNYHIEIKTKKGEILRSFNSKGKSYLEDFFEKVQNLFDS